jgi:hypothetical protein
MRIKPIASNMTELTLANGDRVLFSYETPVALFTQDEFVQTNKKWSKTTTKHINKWFSLSGWLLATNRYENQEYFNNLVKGV